MPNDSENVSKIMKISVVTLSYNQGPYLESAIRSVLLQKEVDIEYIMVDAGSTDGSLDIIRKYREKFAHVLLGPDGGPADGLNRGFSVSTGDICYYLNADDIALPGAFRRAVEYFEEDEDIDVLYGSIEICDDALFRKRRFVSEEFVLQEFALGALVLPQQATFFARRLLERGIHFNVENKSCWDGEFVLDAALRGAKFRRVEDFFGIFRVYPSSITGSGRFAEAYRRDHERMFGKVFNREPGRTDSVRAQFLKWRRRAHSIPYLLRRVSDSAHYKLGRAVDLSRAYSIDIDSLAEGS